MERKPFKLTRVGQIGTRGVPWEAYRTGSLPVSCQPLRFCQHGKSHIMTEGWFRQILRKPKKRHVQPDTNTNDVLELPSQSSSLPDTQESTKVPTPDSADTDSRSSGSRWSKTYDVCVCHSEEDLMPVQELVSYLEGEPDGLRCFLQPRDAAPGGAIVSELCQAMGNSHCCVLFITPHFLQDPWCKYQMLQALSEAPGSEGHTIPLLAGLARSDYPPELRFMFYVDGSGPDSGFGKVKNTVWRYLQKFS
ncbi:toll/interleukin-1 receptor domain-containing adapter protein isoform X2 [Dromiciops gliroides]|uniref:toll/interleukin-1 receptor domain-containing adapter protein isoform X2 n=1 Tax=Dromiciops gliroides TaxID=33562 RepID=UPI001CC36454|nr:toll/interleukin-1 receptor domain-containing adapter protein isoform X2 [Dromiciops gliroides]